MVVPVGRENSDSLLDPARADSLPSSTLPGVEHSTEDAPDTQAPVTKQDFNNLVVEIKTFLATYVAIIKADMQAVSGRVQISEGDIPDLKQDLSILKNFVNTLQAKKYALTLHYTALDDWSSCNHL
ncbi:Hypothetical predicted protein [Pelobates cultripes]|uniref:Uncharacterized protein n=1 Tax=Pelobates cultripes TaxID=61616 RepID=A0AAD1SNQ0_PELCU|nr:Hypothetical predicted protein [Pelobates cultripes]